MIDFDFKKHLPYAPPFLFMDEITAVSETGIKGNYTFPEDSFFYRGHFVGNPVTPGVILIECMAQIGLVCFGLFLLLPAEQADSRKRDRTQPTIAFSESNIFFHKAIYPKEKVVVESQLQYFRFGKLKCRVKLFNQVGELAASGELSGIMLSNYAAEKQ